MEIYLQNLRSRGTLVRRKKTQNGSGLLSDCPAKDSADSRFGLEKTAYYHVNVFSSKNQGGKIWHALILKTRS
jgi:hypothetical protein